MRVFIIFFVMVSSLSLFGWGCSESDDKESSDKADVAASASDDVDEVEVADDVTAVNDASDVTPVTSPDAVSPSDD
jgi:hypothetical protein